MFESYPLWLDLFSIITCYVSLDTRRYYSLPLRSQIIRENNEETSTSLKQLLIS